MKAIHPSYMPINSFSKYGSLNKKETSKKNLVMLQMLRYECGFDIENENSLEVQICKINCTNPDTPCIHKCCGYDEIYSMGMAGQRGGCLRVDPSRNESIWTPALYSEEGERMNAQQLKDAGIRAHVIQSNPTSFRHLCPRNATTVFPYGEQVADFLAAVLRYPFAALKFKMRKDGWLMSPDDSRGVVAISKSKRTTNYCIDGVHPKLLIAFDLLSPELETYKDNLVASATNNQIASASSVATTSTTTTTTTTTTTQKPTTTTTTTTTLKPTTTTTRPTTTTSTTTSIPSTTATPRPAPVLPVCCPIDPDADDDNGNNEISHHCKSSGIGSQLKAVSEMNSTSSLWIASPNFMHTHKITKFRLEVQPLKCEKWTKAFVHNLGKLLSPTEPVLMPDGMLKMGNDYYRQGEFCVNGVFPNIVEVLVCKTNCSDPQTPCIQKCCAPDEVYSLGVGGKKRGCVPLASEDTPFLPVLYNNMTTKVSDNELESMTPHLVQKYPPKFQYNCYKNVTLVFPFSSDVVQLMNPLAQINLEFKLRRDGRVIYKHPNIRDAKGELIESAFSTFNFCVDLITNSGVDERDDEKKTILFVCAVSPPGNP
ncbi:hypothetical protein Ocin01_12936 [Orchesella cincta]|uniref:Uncharacterized protein n=1 Tax=Orchesella cincta TaxID=48709 RepID=A0A1D2ML42_ORCCI|nr:hypothetical protein Ocin01_12936 [Orchesella cincta]